MRPSLATDRLTWLLTYISFVIDHRWIFRSIIDIAIDSIHIERRIFSVNHSGSWCLQPLVHRDPHACVTRYLITGDPLHSWAAYTLPCNENTHSRAHCSPGARLCEQLGHGCVNNGARLCASARLCRGSPVLMSSCWHPWDFKATKHLQGRIWDCNLTNDI